MEIKIASLNLCLGLQSKKNLVKETILHDKIDILCMQETEININLDHNLLSFPGYSIEVEKNSQNATVAFYINNSINYSLAPFFLCRYKHNIKINFSHVP